MRMSTVITAIKNLVTDPELRLGDYYNTRHRANAAGDCLEEYVKDLFAGTLREADEQRRLEILTRVFSYFGNDSNPPDAMLNGGDAIEVKKIETDKGEIQLNSSHPKKKLLSTSQMITETCRNAEGGNWTEKDILYVIGKVKGKMLQAMFMVYGVDYAASEAIYERLKENIKNNILEIAGAETDTKEIGRFNRIDPLGVTSLRIRGMWILQNPWKAFSYITQMQKNKKFEFCAIINRSKCETYEEWESLVELSTTNPNLSISDVHIKKPDNPAELTDAKLIRFTID